MEGREPVILHIDMNAFFASVEQRCNPMLRGREVAVVGASKRSVVVTASYEARKRGVKTGMSIPQARKRCREIVLIKGDMEKYVHTSMVIRDILLGFSPVVEMCSIDEAFVDITGTERLFGPPEKVASMIKKRIRDGLGLVCSIGIAPNRLLAKLASSLEKPDGLVIIKREDIPELLDGLPVERLCGIGTATTSILTAMGIKTCGDLARCPAGILRRRLGIVGERLQRMAMGMDTYQWTDHGGMPKSISHSMTLPEDVSDKERAEGYLMLLCEMVGRRARKWGLKGRRIALTLRYPDFHTFTHQTTLCLPTDDTRCIYLTSRDLLTSLRLKQPMRLMGVTLSALVVDCQPSLFMEDRRRKDLLRVVDLINDRFGEFTIGWAGMRPSRVFQAGKAFHGPHRQEGYEPSPSTV